MAGLTHRLTQGTGGQQKLFPTAIPLTSFVMLGTTVPEPAAKDPTKDSRVVVCSAGVSERGLTRIHPLDWKNIPKRWNRYRVLVERSSKDNRQESFQVAVDNNCNDGFQHRGGVNKKDRSELLEPYKLRSIQKANEDRISLGILEPKKVKLCLESSGSVSTSAQWFYKYGLPVKARERYPYIPRLHFDDEDGYHNLMLRDWGIYERMRKILRKNPNYEPDALSEDLYNSLSLSEASCLFVGNYLHYRNAWCVISVLNGIRSNGLPLML